MLVPIKKSVLKSLEQLRREKTGDLLEDMKYVIRRIEVDKNDFITKAGVHYFAGDHKGGLQSLFDALGAENVKSFPNALTLIRTKYGTNQTDSYEKHCIEVIAFLFFFQSHYKPALDYYSWFVVDYVRDPGERWSCQNVMAQCLTALGNYPAALLVYQRILTGVKEFCGANAEDDLSSYLTSSLRRSPSMSDMVRKLAEFAARNYTMMGRMLIILGREAENKTMYNQALQLLRLSESLGADTRSSIASLLFHMAQSYLYTLDLQDAAHSTREALGLWHSLYGQRANHSSIQACYVTLGDISHDLGNYDEALDWLSKASDMSAHLHSDQGPHPQLAKLYGITGSVYANKGNNQQAIEYFLKAIKIHEANPENCDPGSRAGVYLWLAEQQLETAQYEDCNKSVRRALQILSTMQRVPSKVMLEGEAFRLLAEVCLATGSLDKATEYTQKALRLCAGFSDIEANTRLTISKIHEGNHNLPAAITEAECAVTVLKGLWTMDNGVSILLEKCLAARKKYRHAFLAENAQDAELTRAHLALAVRYKDNNNLIGAIKETEAALRTVKGVRNESDQRRLREKAEETLWRYLCELTEPLSIACRAAGLFL